MSRNLSLAGSGRLLKLFSAAVMDQVLLSGASLAVGFVLIRFTSDRDYGLYVLVLTTQQLLISVQRSYLTGPLALVAARKSADARRTSVGAIRNAVRRALLWALMLAQVVPLAGYLLGWVRAPAAVLLAAAVLSSYLALRREFLRDILLLYSRPHALLVADVVFALVLVAGVLLAACVGSSAVLWTLMTLSLAALAGATLAERMLAASPGWVGGDVRPVLREILPLGFWATVGTLTYWIYGQSFNYMLAGRVDLKAVADVNATRLMLMPPIVLTVGVQALLIPTAAAWYAEAGLTRLMRRLLAFILGMVLLDLTYLGVLWIGRDWVTVSLMHKQIGARDQLLMLWAVVALIGVLRDVLQCALFALGRLKSMAGQGAFSAAIAVALTWFGISWWGAPAVLVGQIAAEVVNLVGIGWLLRLALSRAAAESTPGPH
jgi:O-antigen/teichoic acid export membrane protein